MIKETAKTVSLSVLCVEDSLIDFELIRDRLNMSGYSLNIVRTEKEDELISLLSEKCFDIIIADYNLPGFDAFRVLELCKKHCHLVPFVCVSGYIGEMKAIELLKQGAVDYVLKDRMERLPFVVKRALEEAKHIKVGREMEESLHRSEEKYRTIFENVQDVFYQTDLNGIIREISPSIKYFTDFKSEDLVGKQVHEIYFNPDDRLKLLQVISQNGEVRDYEIRMKTKLGELKFASINARLILNHLGKPDHIDGSLRDITRRKLVEQELVKAKDKAEASDRLKTAFMNNISHEIRTPLNAIQGFAPLIIDPSLNFEEKQELLDILNASTQRLIQTITNYMDISLIASGNMDVAKSEFQLSELLLEVQHQFQRICEEKLLRFNVVVPLHLQTLKIVSDRRLLQKIFGHLMDNAIKFTKFGNITFEVDNRDDFVQFSIRDSGIGIKEEVHARIFKHFVQEDDSSHRSYEGSGLGLSIVEGLVVLLGGTIRFESEKGNGSTFLFTIPLPGKEPQEKTSAEQGILPVVNQRPLLLIVEDDDSSYRLLERLLRSSHTILRAENGPKAVELCRMTPTIQLILMDVKLPGMNGYEATKEIRFTNKKVIVIAQTAHGLSGEKEKAMEAGCNDYISKPINISELKAMISKYLK